jgi:glycosyltransferase involved in cell wall biosynthesis
MQPSSERLAGAAVTPRLRILIVTDEMEVGGSQRQIVNLARGLDRACHDVTVLYFRHRSFLVDELEAAGVRVRQLPKRGRVDPFFLRELRRELLEGRYDIVHAFAFSAELWAAVTRRLLPAARRPELVSSIRGTYGWYGRLHWWLKRWITRQSSRVVANSHSGADFACERMGWPRSAIDVVYNGVQPQPTPMGRREELRNAWGLRPDDVVALFVGRLVPVKDVQTLLRASARLCDHLPQVHVVICGDGPQRDSLRALAVQLGLQLRLHFLGERADVPALIDAADLLVLCSRQEGLSNVILEAMHGARPVVASAVGGTIELVDDGVNGLLFEAGDDAALASAVSRLACDPLLRKRLGRAGAARMQRQFSTEAMVAAMAGLYREVPLPFADKRRAAATIDMTQAQAGSDVRNLG